VAPGCQPIAPYLPRSQPDVPAGGCFSQPDAQVLMLRFWLLLLGGTDIQIRSMISAASQMNPAKLAGFFS